MKLSTKVALKQIKQIESEVERFQTKLNKIKKMLKEDSSCVYGSRDMGALKRSILDLREELFILNKNIKLW